MEITSQDLVSGGRGKGDCERQILPSSNPELNARDAALRVVWVAVLNDGLCVER